MATLRSRGEEKKSLLKPHLCQCQLIFELSLYRNGAEGVLSINHHPSTAAPLHSARPKIKLFFSVKWRESSENALFIEKSWIIMLRIKIPCNRATSCNSSGRLKPPSSQPTLVRVGGTVQDLPSTWLVQEAWLCSRCAAELWIVNCELWIECHARCKSITCMHEIGYMHVPPAFHARNLWRRFI